MSQFEVKGYLEGRDYAVILAMVAVPLLLLLSRLAVLPGSPLAQGPVGDLLAPFGAWLDNTFTLAWIAPADRHKVVYLLMLPTAGLVITVARLTFGLRVLGLRSILIAVAFHEIGVLPSLVVMAVVIGVIVLLRPWMRRMRLPMYARLSLILGITAGIQVLFLLVGGWQRSDLIWNLAFFPVIILAMMAESIAGTLDSDSVASAAWRLGWTLAVALLLSFIMGSPDFLGLLLAAPELLVLQLAVIILVAEHADFRLLQDWQAGAQRLLLGGALAPRRRRVAVVVNRSANGTISRHRTEDPAAARRESIQHVLDALRSDGYLVRVFEGDMQMLRELSRFLPPHPRTGAPGGVVLNLSQGIQGLGRHGHVPAMLEMAGVAYTGSDPVGHALRADRFVLLTQLQGAGVPVPPFRLLDREAAFPLRVRACHDEAEATLLRSEAELRTLLAQGAGSARWIVDGLPAGDDYHVGVIGNERLECLPVVRVDARGKPQQCPAVLDDASLERLRACAMQAYRAGRCRDFARVDLRLDPQGRVCVLDLRTQGILGRKGSVGLMVAAAGIGWTGLLRRMVELAARRNHVEWLQPHDATPALADAEDPHPLRQPPPPGPTHPSGHPRPSRHPRESGDPGNGRASRRPEPHASTTPLMGLRSLLLLLAALAFTPQVNARTPTAAPHCTRDTGPTHLTPAAWTDPAHARQALAQPGFTELEFTTQRGARLKARIHRPRAFDPREGRIWFVMHGTARNAGRYLELAAPVAERYRALAVAVEFPRTHYPSGDDYTLGVVQRGPVDASALPERRWRAPAAYEYNEIERVFEALRASLGGTQRGYYLFGHSAGAQFTHRLLTFVPCARVKAAVAANAGWYTLPGWDDGQPPIPYSLRGTPDAPANARALLPARLIVLLGTADTGGASEDRNLRDTPAAQAQGANRLARGRHYFDSGRSLATRLGVEFGWELHLVPGAGHDAAQVIAPAGRLLFESPATRTACLNCSPSPNPTTNDKPGGR